MNAVASKSDLKLPGLGGLSAQDVKVLLKALGQWGVAEEAGVSGEALDEYAVRARDAFTKVAQAA